MRRDRSWRGLGGGHAIWLLLVVVCGCGPVVPSRPATLFTMPLSVEGASVGPAILDTGGGYELILRNDFGLPVQGEAEVLAFGGLETVSVARGFSYEVGGVKQSASAALIAISSCRCNGVGFFFFRKTGRVLALNFGDETAEFLTEPPEDAVHLPFAPPPPVLEGFDTAFVEVEVAFEGVEKTLLALLDTGTNATFIRAGTFNSPSRPLLPDLLDLRIARSELGTVAVRAGVYATQGLPDLIIGTDVMRAWAPRWYFTYSPQGGTITALPFSEPAEPDPAAGSN